MMAVYKITNPKGAVYVGSTINVVQRKNHYRFGNKNQTKIYRSIMKYGWINHKFEILEECSRDKLRERELYYGTLFNVLSPENLNILLPKDGEICSHRSDEHKRIMSESAKKRFTPEIKKKMWEGRRKAGWSVSQEMRERISKTLSKKVRHIETGKEFDSLKEGAKFFNIPYGTLTAQMSKREKSRLHVRYKNTKAKPKLFEYI
jgi:group I intron endonuclease